VTVHLLLNLKRPDNKTHVLVFEADSGWAYEPEWDELYFKKTSSDYNNRRLVYIRRDTEKEP
jgi:hypothetical protein